MKKSSEWGKNKNWLLHLLLNWQHLYCYLSEVGFLPPLLPIPLEPICSFIPLVSLGMFLSTTPCLGYTKTSVAQTHTSRSLLKARFYWDLPMKYQLHGKSKVTAVWAALRISCESCRWDYSSAVLLSPKQNPVGLWPYWPLQHTHHPLLEIVAQAQNGIISNSHLRNFVHLKKLFLLTIYKYLIKVNSATGTTGNLHLHYFKYKIGFVTTGPVYGESSRLSDIPT